MRPIPIKRMFAFFLSIILMLSLLPTSAMAADVEDISSHEQDEAQDLNGPEDDSLNGYSDNDINGSDQGSDDSDNNLSLPDSVTQNNENNTAARSLDGDELIDRDTVPTFGLDENTPVGNEPLSAITDSSSDPVAVTGVSVDQTELTLTVGGEPATLTATVEPENADDKTVAWSSSNEAVATVADGVVTPVAMGETTITVTTSDGGFSASCSVIVSGVAAASDPVAVTGVSLDQAELTLTVGGEAATLTATVEPENADDKTVAWSSSNEAVATVADGVVTPVAMGETTITVTTSDGGFSASCAVKVWGTCGADTRWFISGTTLTISGTGDMADYTSVRDRPWKTTDAAKITSVVVEEGVTSIGAFAFNNFSKLTSISLPSTLRTIGKSALAGLTGLTSITLPAGITSIDSSAFGTKLKEIHFLGTADEWFALGYDYDPAKISVYGKDGNLIEKALYDGNCGANGDNVTWHYDPDTKTLTISGTGEMKEYTKPSLVPWYAYASEIQSVVVGSGVTSIGGYAFSGYTALAGIQLADSVTKIGANAFSGDTELTGIDLSHVSIIGDSAFLGCSGLSSASLTSATSIGTQAFANCKGLESVVLGSGSSAVTSMGIRAFQNCERLSSVTFANVETIADYSFQGTVLTAADLSRTVSIGMNAFSGIKTLEAVSFGESLRSIGGGAFSGTGLTEVTIPGNVESIGSSAFSGCTNMTEATIAEGITELPQSLFNGNTGLKKVILPVSLEKVGGYAFNRCEALEEVNYAGTTAQWKAVVVEDNNDPLIALMNSGSNPVAVTGVSLDQTELTLTVGGEAATLTATVEPENADDKTVAWSSSNEAVATVADGVVTPVAMGETTIIVTTSDGGFSASCAVKVWGTCGADTRWFISGTTLTISGTGDMADYTSVKDRPWKTTDAAKITSVVVEEGVTSIGAFAFNNFSKLTSISLPSTLRTIGKSALAGLTGLTSITLPAGITSIDSTAFGTKLKEIHFLGTADEWFAIGYDYDPAKISVYDKDGNLIERDPYNGSCGVNGDNVTWHYDPDTKILTISGTGEMKEYTKAALVPWYAHAPEIQSVVVGAGVTSISGYAFAGYTDLTNVQLAESVTTIGKNAFNADTGLTEIDLSHVSTVGDSAFLGCSGLKNATLTNAASIGAQAFANCSGLESVVLGSETAAVTSMGIRAFQNCSSLSTVTFANVETISDYSFQGTALTTAELNRTVTIGMAAFSGLNTLTNVSFGESLCSIGGSAFSGTGLTEVTIPGNVESIGNSAFSGCTNMTEATIAEGITELPQSLFNGNTGLKKVTLPISLEKVGGYAFNGCGLEEVNYAGTTVQWKAVVVEDNNDPLIALMDSGSDPVAVTGVSLDQTELTLTVGGEAATLTATVEPEDADDKTVTWSSSNEAIATVEDGVVTPVAMGETTITVTTSDGGFSASCDVKVENTSHEVDLTGFTFTLFDTYTQDSSIFNYNNSILVFELSGGDHGILYAPVCSVFSRTNIRPGIRIDAPEGYEGEFTVSYIGWESEGNYSCLGEQSLSSKNGSASIKHYYNVMSTSYRTLQYTDYFRLSFPDGSEITLDLHLFNELCGISIKPGTIGEPIGNDGAVSVTSTGDSIYSATLIRGTTYSISIRGGINGSHYIPETKVYIDGQLSDDLPQNAYWYTPGEESEKDITIRLVNADTSNDIIEMTYTLHINVVAVDEPPVFNRFIVTQNGLEVSPTPSGKRYTLKDTTQYDDISVQIVSDNLGDDVSYQWMQGVIASQRVPVGDNTDTLTIDTSTTNAMQHYYVCIVTSKGVSYTSPIFFITRVNVLSFSPPIITRQPCGAVYNVGDQIKRLSVEIESPLNGHYQWYECGDENGDDSTQIEGAVQSYIFPDVTAPGSYWYYCEIWYEKETVISDRTRSDIVEIRVVNNALWPGDGTSENPFVLSDESSLVALREAVANGSSYAGMYFCFANDIALSGSWIPIGTLKEGATSTGQGTNILPFSGTIDGCGYTIEVAPKGKPLFNYVRGATVNNLNIYGTEIAGYGLVDRYTVDYGATGDYWNTGVPETISINNCHILSGTRIMYSGFLGGYASGLNIVRITNCTVAEGVIIGYGMTEVMPDGNSTSVGSLAGDFNGYVTNCTSAATVMGQRTVGGLIGAKGQSMGPCNVTGSSFTGTITSNGNAGGIIGAGYNSSNSPCVVIENCTVSGTITGSGAVGGILGREGEIVQEWGNGVGGIRNNRFTGTINASGQNIGGIIGYMCSLNDCNVIENNYYASGCGAERGIGFVKYVDTNCATHETASGATYFDTSVALPGIAGVTESNHNRTDDPLGADKEKLCYSEEKTEAYVTDIILSGTYKTDYQVGDTLDTTGMAVTAKWSDGSTTNPAVSEVTITGFDTSEPGEKLITVKYGDSSTTFTITIKPKSQKITVTITVLGDSVHDSDADGVCHGGNKLSGLQTWVAATPCEADAAETVWAVLQRLAADKGLSIRNPSGNYIEAINGLGEFTNGQKSGWLYTLNGSYPSLGVNEQYLHDGDVIVIHYTDNYEKDGVDMGGNPDQDAQAVNTVEKLIDAIGTPVTLDSKAKIEAAREAYDKLTYAQKSKVSNYDKLTAAEEELKNLQATADKEAADRVIALIDNINLQNEYTVTAARAGYDSLTDAQKALVTNYDKLVQAEEKLEEEHVSPEDIRAANAVTIKIRTLNDPVTLEDEAAIKDAREAYERLTAVQKRLVKAIDRLVDAENQLAQLKATEPDRQAASEVQAQIEALNSPVTLEDEAAIKDARIAYDALTETQKGLVTNAKKLTDAERELALLKASAEDKAAAKDVEAKISALHTPVTLEDEKAIQDARKAYDELTETQKALVSNIEALKTAEYKLAELKATEEDKAAAKEVEKLIEALNLPVSLEDEAAIKAAREAYDKLTETQKALVNNRGRLIKAETDLAKLQENAKGRDIYKITGDYLAEDYLGDLDSPVVGSVGGEWMVIGLARSGREVPGGDGYYNSAVDYVRENINENEQLHWARSSDNSRMILALTAQGYDPTNVDGHDLLMGLTDMEYVKKQGINGPIWALIAFDSDQYQIPENPNAADQVTREKIIDYILGEQLTDGGWALTGDISDPDITGMALQALAPYYKTNPEVKKAVDEALETVSRMQNADGTFTSSMSGGEPSSESVSQILVALSALGIDAEKDGRFIKNGNTILDALAMFFVEGGGFRHVLDGQRDGMATEQAYYALTAYFRMLDGKTSLYDMTDVAVLLAAPAATATPEPTEAPKEPEEEVALAVDAAEGENEKSRVSAWWILPPTGVAGIVAFLLDKKRRRAK